MAGFADVIVRWWRPWFVVRGRVVVELEFGESKIRKAANSITPCRQVAQRGGCFPRCFCTRAAKRTTPLSCLPCQCIPPRSLLTNPNWEKVGEPLRLPTNVRSAVRGVRGRQRLKLSRRGRREAHQSRKGRKIQTCRIENAIPNVYNPHTASCSKL
jgi:hypothetical protein